MKPTVRVYWEGEDANQVIIDNFDELVAFLCSNRESGIVYHVEMFEYHDMCINCTNKVC